VCSLEFKRQAFQQYYWKGKHEVDFVIFNPDISLFNVTYTDSISSREIDGLVEAMEHFSLQEATLLTKNTHSTEIVQDKKVHCVPVWAWLLSHQK
jgi:predicted AAA+ superfamily ATPase